MTVRRFHAEAVTAIGTGALGVAGVVGAMQLGHGWSESGPESGYFPFYVGVILILASLWNLGTAFVAHRAALVREGQGEIEEPFLDGERLGRLARFGGTMIAFVILTLVMGIYVGAAAYIAWSAWRTGGYRAWVALAFGLGFSLALYVIFEIAFLVPLLKGPIEPLLGIY
ncbi:tripartite tricarboxylate transporter TctB family protein [Paracoccus sp. NGMCC 1.201697]|uniref:Tripartite tricarboxylate transporter TctB family protein n=1 Tax=Paracoccus broussonetiae subsp. drimophilus TaxID=3373869 RepID=A0ABW7LMF7_9RHOB